MNKAVLGILLIVSVCGCTMPGDFMSAFNMGGEVNTTEQSPDLIVIQNINVIPSPPINAGDMFTVSFEIVNQDDTNSVDIGYQLYDYGLCAAPSEGIDTAAGDPLTMAPLQTEFIEWQFTAPLNGELGGLSTSCPIKFLIGYTFDAKSQIDVDVISSERLYEMQRAGQSVSFTPSLSVGRGPVKVYFSFGTSLPVRDSSVLPLFINIDDKGDGILRSISEGALSITMPSEFGVSCSGFNCNNGVCTNIDEIPMIKKSAPQMRCQLTSPSSEEINHLEKTFYISASLSYAYEITGETSVGVKPILA